MKSELVIKQLTEGLDPSVAAICEQLIATLCDAPAHELRRISVSWLASIVRRRWNDQVMQTALATLTTIRNHPLDLYFIMYDEIMKDEIKFEVDEVSHGLEDGELIHPHTGYAIPNFTAHLKPVYRLNSQFEKLIAADE